MPFVQLRVGLSTKKQFLKLKYWNTKHIVIACIICHSPALFVNILYRLSQKIGLCIWDYLEVLNCKILPKCSQNFEKRSKQDFWLCFWIRNIWPTCHSRIFKLTPVFFSFNIRFIPNINGATLCFQKFYFDLCSVWLYVTLYSKANSFNILSFWLNINGWLVESFLSRLSATRYEYVNFEYFWRTEKEERES